MVAKTSVSRSHWAPFPATAQLSIFPVGIFWGKAFKPKRFDGTDLFEGDTSQAIPDIDAKLHELDIICWEMPPGDVVAFNFRTLHEAPGDFVALVWR